MPLLEELRKKTADVLKLKIDQLNATAQLTEEDTKLFNDIERTLKILAQSGFQQTNNDGLALRGIHDAFQHMLEITLKSKAMYKFDLKDLLWNLNKICIQTCFNHYLSTHVQEKNKFELVYQALQIGLSKSGAKKKVKKEMGERLIIIVNEMNDIDITSLMSMLTEMEDNKKLKDVLAVRKLLDCVSGILFQACCPFKPFANTLMTHPESILRIEALGNDESRVPIQTAEPEKISSSTNAIKTSGMGVFGKSAKNKEKEKRVIPESSHNEFSNMTIKIRFLGAPGCGKVSTLLRLSENVFSDAPVKKPGVKGVSMEVSTMIGTQKVNLGIISGGNYRTHPLREADAVVILMDVTDQNALSSLPSYQAEVERYANEDTTVILAGNKADEKTLRKITNDQAKDYADNMNLNYFEFSAKSTENINATFLTLVDLVNNRRELLNENPFRI